MSAAKGLALDLFCGAGGVSVGLHRAGFEVVGVDLANQPRYPFEFIRGDALRLLTRSWLNVFEFDFIWASPPCQHYSDLAHRNGNADEHPDLINPVRQLLEGIGVPYVIENVEGAPLRDPRTICGTERGLGVDGYRLRRHRLFESNFPLLTPPCACYGTADPIIDVSGGGPTHAPRLDGGGGRTYKGTVAQKRAAMGIDWMTGGELVEAIPPAYAELIAAQVPTRLEVAA
jgi:DNA (cytosine-5)-methyltransferase 1